MSAVGKFVCTYILDKIIISDEQIIELNIGPDTEPDIEPSIEADIELNIVLSKGSNIEPNINEETQKISEPRRGIRIWSQAKLDDGINVRLLSELIHITLTNATQQKIFTFCCVLLPVFFIRRSFARS